MNLSYKNVSVLTLTLFLATVAQANHNNESEIARFMSETSVRLAHFNSKLVSLSSNQVSLENLINSFQIKKEADDLDSAMRARIRATDLNSIRNADLKRQLKVLNTSVYALNEDDRMKILKIVSDLGALSSNQIICRYGVQNSCQMSYFTDVRDIYVNSSDPSELQYYWEQCRNKISKAGMDGFIEFVKLFRKSSDLMGREALENWYWPYDDPHLIDELNNLMEKLKPLYSELHAYIRYELRKKYGEIIVPEKGPIPQYLLEQVILQAKEDKTILDQPYPQKKMPNLTIALDATGLNTSRKRVLAAAAFFESLGMDPVPSENLPDNLDETDFIRLHGNMAGFQYRTQRGHLPFGLNREACPGFESALHKAAELSASSPKHLQGAKILAQSDFDKEKNINRLFYQALKTILTIPVHYVNEKLIINAMTRPLTSRNWNCLYWSLMDENAGVEPHSERSDTQFDVSIDFYNEFDGNTQTGKILSEILGHQLYKGLCTRSGQYNCVDDSIQNCDFSGSLNAGTALREMMSLGSRKPWQEVLKSLTSEDRLNIDDILKYYEPLYIWLKDFNKAEDIHVGWNRSQKCKSD